MAEHSGKDILSSDVEIKGSIKFQKELLIDGKVEGEINSDGVLTIGENADIQGEIKTKSITVYGKVRGNMHCAGTATVNYVGKIPGRLTAEHVLVERKSDVQFFRQVRVKSIEIRGRMSGEIVADAAVVIHRNATLDGNVTAKSISVEKGGIFTGQLVIGNAGLTQAELLPETKPAAAPDAEVIAPEAVPHPLPAT